MSKGSPPLSLPLPRVAGVSDGRKMLMRGTTGESQVSMQLQEEEEEGDDGEK